MSARHLIYIAWLFKVEGAKTCSVICLAFTTRGMSRVGQNRIYTSYMAVYLVISLPKMPYTNRI